MSQGPSDGYPLWDKFAGILADDIVFMPPDQPAVEGKGAVRAWLEKFPPAKEYSISLVRTEGGDDFAWGWAMFAVTVEPEPGKSMTLKGKATCTLRKQLDGSWLVASDIWNLDEPPPAG